MSSPATSSTLTEGIDATTVEIVAESRTRQLHAGLDPVPHKTFCAPTSLVNRSLPMLDSMLGRTNSLYYAQTKSYDHIAGFVCGLIFLLKCMFCITHATAAFTTGGLGVNNFLVMKLS